MRWQPYAAVTAAAYAKDLLAIITPRAVEQSEVAQCMLRFRLVQGSERADSSADIWALVDGANR
jgi:hypothetical protein